MVEVINPLSRSMELTPSDLHLLSLLQDLNHKKERDYEKDVRPLFAGFPPSLSEFTIEHLEAYEAALKASDSFPPEIAVEFDKLKTNFFPLIKYLCSINNAFPVYKK